MLQPSNSGRVAEGEPQSGRVSREAAKGGKPPSNGPLIIGVTGGMASGKSTVARMIAGRGILHVDADKIVHHLLQHDRPTIAALKKQFPSAEQNGVIQRSALAAAIGKNPEALATLERILHPRVRAWEEGAISFARRRRARALILDVPLLFETDAHELCDIVIVAHSPFPLRKRRAFARPGMTPEKWERLISRQLPDAIRNRAADEVIATGIGKAATRRRIDRLMKAWGLS